MFDNKDKEFEPATNPDKFKYLDISHIFKSFNIGNFINKKNVLVLDDISLKIEKGQTYGLVGESGSGKTTLGNLILRFYKEDKGRINFFGTELTELDNNQIRKIRTKLQMVFQNPVASLDPRKNIFFSLKEGLTINGIQDKQHLKKLIDDIIVKVGLNPSDLDKKPHEFSGGQCQRVAIAKVLLLNPDFIVLDEAVSALDVSIQAQIINLLVKLQRELKLTYLFISHDLGIVNHISDVIGVMYLGTLVEEGRPNEIFNTPLHPYTQLLIDSLPGNNTEKSSEEEEIPSLFERPIGCPFVSRCKFRMEKCSKVKPPVFVVNDRKVKCFLYE